MLRIENLYYSSLYFTLFFILLKTLNLSRIGSLLLILYYLSFFHIILCKIFVVRGGIVMEDLIVSIDTLWVLLCGVLVFFMNAGFGLLETGLTRSKNAVNILAKNFVVFAIASLGFWVIGWGFMFGNGNGFIGMKGLFFLLGADNSPMINDAYQGVYSAISWTGIPLMAKFFFQLAFAATAATIISGCVAERIKFIAFLIFSFFIIAILYPIVGHWTWGGGWLSSLGFHDFAGSTVVHSVGGWAGLMAIIVLGPRIGEVF